MFQRKMMNGSAEKFSGVLVLKPRARLFHGHDWVYGTEVLSVSGEPEDGGVVLLKDRKGKLLGSAIYNGKSQIVARRYCKQKQALDDDFFERRIEQAWEFRKALGYAGRDACRVVWSESDGLPGLVVDRYRDCLVVQALTLAMDRRLPQIAAALRRVLKPSSIIARNDATVRKAEGMQCEVALLLGSPPAEIPVDIDGISFRVRPMDGQKTGFYLDQVDAYPVVAMQARGRRVLDCFANQGAFALHCARAGASSVQAVEVSGSCVDAIRAAAAENGLAVEAIEANAFDFLREAEAGGGQYDLIILDPPSFTRSKGRHADALRGYKEIHLRALKLLAPGGLIATFCCSHHVSENDYREVVVSASVDAHRHLRLLRRFHQSCDHPVLPHIPESEYLKGFLLGLLPAR